MVGEIHQEGPSGTRMFRGAGRKHTKIFIISFRIAIPSENPFGTHMHRG